MSLLDTVSIAMEAHLLSDSQATDEDNQSDSSSTTMSLPSAAFDDAPYTSDSNWSSPEKSRCRLPRERTYLMYWDLLGFLKDQDAEDYRQISLGSIITLTGTGPCSQATTAAEYLSRNWPSTGLILLEAFQSALQDDQGQSLGM